MRNVRRRPHLFFFKIALVILLAIFSLSACSGGGMGEAASSESNSEDTNNNNPDDANRDVTEDNDDPDPTPPTSQLISVENITGLSLDEDVTTQFSLAYTGGQATDCSISNLVNITEEVLCACDGDGLCQVSLKSTLNYNGPASLDFIFTNDAGTSATGSASLTVDPVNDDPVPVLDTGSTLYNLPVTIDILSNDTDIDLDTLSVSSVTDGTGGSVVYNGDGTATFTPSSAFHGTGDFTYQLEDGQGGSVVGNAQITVDPVAIINETDSGFTSTGSWTNWINTSCNLGACFYNNEGTGLDKAQWTFDNIASGAYKVSVDHDGNSAWAKFAPFSLFDGNNTGAPFLGSVFVNQELDPSSSETVANGATWDDIGFVMVTGSSITVELTDLADDAVMADAVRIERVGATIDYDSMYGLDVRIIDQGELGFSTTGTNWSGFSNNANYKSTSVYSSSGVGANRAQWVFTGLTSGAYKVSTEGDGNGSFSSTTPFSVFDGDNVGAPLLGSVVVSQKLDPDPDETVANGTTWNDFGLVTITGSALTVEMNDNADGGVNADAIRIERVGPSIDYDSMFGTDVRIIDQGEFGFSVVGSSWISFSNDANYRGQSIYHTPGTGTVKARWLFNDLTAGAYKVSIEGDGNGTFSEASPFTIYDGDDNGDPVLGFAHVDQSTDPNSAETVANGTTWDDIGIVEISGTNLLVELTDDTYDEVNADAIRIERIGASLDLDTIFGAGVRIIDQGEIGFSTTGTGWVGNVNGSHYKGKSIYRNEGASTASAIWTFENLTTGAYRVSVEGDGNGSWASNSPFTVFDGNTTGAPSLGTAYVNQEADPTAGETVGNGTNWRDLGIVVITGTALTVELDNDANDAVNADAIRIEYLGATLDLDSEFGTDVQIIDSGEIGFSMTGSGWISNENGSHHQDVALYNNEGTGLDTATWEFKNLTSGTYEVAWSCNGTGSWASNTSYEIFDDLTSRGSFIADQTVQPNDISDNGNGWGVLSSSISITSGTLKVVVTDAANDAICVDAIRIEKQ